MSDSSLEQRVASAALLLMIAAGGSGLYTLLTLIFHERALDAVRSVGGMVGFEWLVVGGANVPMTLAVLLVHGFIFWTAREMSETRNHAVCVVGAALACVPCWGCCVLNIPAGAFALVTLLNPAVREEFTS